VSGRGAGPNGVHWRDQELRCRDGVRLVSRLWSPPGDGPWPVLLMRQPYGRAIASTVTSAHPSWYAAHGFLVVVQDVRGRGDSQGEFLGFAQEAADGADSVRWARSLPQSNGQLGCYGFSYQGLTQLLSDDAEALPDCLAPAMTGLDERNDWACEGGAHRWALGLGWGLQLAAQACQRRGDADGWDSIRSSLESGSFLRDGPALLERHDPNGMARRWLHQDPSQETGWQRHEIAEALLRRPMLLIGGWHDPHLRGILDLWQRSQAAGGAPLLRIGAWSHLDWQGGIDQLQLAFFQHHLQQQPAEPDLAAAVLLQDAGSLRWAPLREGAARQNWGLATGGLAAIRADEGRLLAMAMGGGSVSLVHDPWRPAPGRGGHLGLDAGPCERSDLDGRSDVACFTSTPVGQVLILEGQPLLELVAQADQPSFDLCAALSRLPADSGTVQQLCTGVGRFRGAAGQPQRCQLALQPLRIALQPGERLRLSLAPAAWPQIGVNPGDGTTPAGPSSSRHRVINLILQLAEAQLQLLPLLSGTITAK